MIQRSIRCYQHRQFWGYWFSWLLLAGCCFSGMVTDRVMARSARNGFQALANELILKFNQAAKFNRNATVREFLTAVPTLDTVFTRFQLKQIYPLDLSKKYPHWPHIKKKSNQPTYHQFFRFVFRDTVDMKWVIPWLAENPSILFVEPNYCYMTETSTRFRLSRQQSSDDFLRDKFIFNKKLKLSPEPPNLLIGCFGESVRTEQFNFLLQCWQNTGEIPQNDLDDDQNGYVDDRFGWQVTPVDSQQSVEKHAAPSSTGKEIFLEINPGNVAFYIFNEIAALNQEILPGIVHTQIMPVNGRKYNGAAQTIFTTSECVEGITYAVDNGVKILLFDWNGPHDSYFLQEAIEYAAEHTVMMIAAAGDANSDQPHYPAAYESVLAVAATDANGVKAAHSNYGTWIAVSAGSEVILPDKKVASGTSVAATMVSALAALITAKEGEAHPDTLKKKIIYSCDNIDSLNHEFDGLLGAGQINPWRALKGIHQSNIVVRTLEIQERPNETDLRIVPGETVSLTISAENIAADATNVSFSLVATDPVIEINPTRWRVADFSFKQTAANETHPFRLKLQTGVPVGFEINANLVITIDGQFHKIIPVQFQVCPEPPRQVTAVPARDGQSAFVFWEKPPTSRLKGCHVYRQIVGNSDWQPLTTEPIKSNRYWDKNLNPAQLYRYAVASVSSGEITSPLALSDTISISQFEDIQFVAYSHWQLSRKPKPVTLANMNEDQYVDLLVNCQSAADKNYSSLVLYQGLADGEFEPVPIDSIDGQSSLLVDLDQDGDLDSWSWHSSGEWHFRRNNGEGEFIQDENIQLSATFPPVNLIDDFDHNGHLDFLTNNEQLMVYFNQGNLNFSPVKAVLDLTATKLVCDDLNQDQQLDLLVIANDNQELKIFNGDEAGIFNQKAAQNIATGVQDLVVIDLNATVGVDLALLVNAGSAHSLLEIWLNDGKGIFQQHQKIEIPFTNKLHPGDIDNDGDFDFVVLHTDQSAGTSISMILNNGQAVFNPITSELTPQFYQEMLLMDADADGDFDLMTFDSTANRMQLWVNNVAAVKANNPPTPPAKCTAQLDSERIWLQWEPGQDEETPSRSLTYNFRIRTNTEIPGINQANGCPGIGNLKHRQSIEIHPQPHTTYYWCVQTVDAGFQTSAWSSVQSVTVKNRPPTVRAFWPAMDTTLLKGDSLTFRVQIFDADADSLDFQWFINDSLALQFGDSLNFTAVNTQFDSIQCVIADADTQITLKWPLHIQSNNKPPLLLAVWPDTNALLLTRRDSLTFMIQPFDPDSDRLSISWQVNGGTKSAFQDSARFRFRPSPLSARSDTVKVFVADEDTLIQHHWIVKIVNSNHPPEIIYFWPSGDTSLVEGDSLKFQIWASDADQDSLFYRWAINGQIDSSQQRQSFKYMAQFLNADDDSVKVAICDPDTVIFHQWVIRVININHLPEQPQPLFPLNDESVLETEFLKWSGGYDQDPEDSLLTYRIEIALDSSFYEIVSSDSVVGDTTLLFNNCVNFKIFKSRTHYYWRVWAIDHAFDSLNFTAPCQSFYFIQLSAQVINAFAQINTEGKITLFWETAYEHENAGFNILRKTEQTDSDVRAGENYYYRIESVSLDGVKIKHQIIKVTAPIPESFALHQNYPNPLTFETVIRYQIPYACQVKLFVYNILGEVVRTLVNQYQEKGFYGATWNGRDDDGREVGSGIYFYSIITDKFQETRKLMKVR